MKNLFLPLLAVFALFSCKVSDSVTANSGKNPNDHLVYDQVSKSADLSGKNTFKVIEQTDASKDILQLNRIFERKLIDNGFSPANENPQLFVQSVIASVNFEKEVLGFVGSVGLSDRDSYSPPQIKSGQYGKVIFLIQDAKTNEVLWMGTGTGILTANEVLNTKEIKSVLDQLIAELK
jgi:hypothetical protein